MPLRLDRPPSIHRWGARLTALTVWARWMSASKTAWNVDSWRKAADIGQRKRRHLI